MALKHHAAPHFFGFWTRPARVRPTRGAPCLCFTYLAGPVGQKRHSQPRKGPREAKAALTGSRRPDPRGFAAACSWMFSSVMVCFTV